MLRCNHPAKLNVAVQAVGEAGDAHAVQGDVVRVEPDIQRWGSDRCIGLGDLFPSVHGVVEHGAGQRQGWLREQSRLRGCGANEEGEDEDGW